MSTGAFAGLEIRGLVPDAWQWHVFRGLCNGL